MRYGIFGCTADPFTPTHRYIVDKVLKNKIVDKVIVIPTIVDYYRKDKSVMFSLQERKQIVLRWLGNRTDVILDFYEYELVAANSNDKTAFKDRRYWHTLRDIKQRYAAQDKDAAFYTIVGSDSWKNLDSWFNSNELLKDTLFIIALRDINDKLFKTIEVNGEKKPYAPFYVFSLPIELERMSATAIRKHLEGVSGSKLEAYMNAIDCYMDSKTSFFEDAVEKQASNASADELIAHTPIFDLVKSPEVEAGFRPVKIKSKDWVSIVVEKDGRYLTVTLLRHGLRKIFEEFPCGIIEYSETPLDAALRELREETGYEVLDRSKVQFLGKFAANPAFMTNYMHYFYVNLDNARFRKTETQLDEHEHIATDWADKKEMFEDFMTTNGSAIMGSMWMLLMKSKLFKT